MKKALALSLGAGLLAVSAMQAKAEAPVFSRIPDVMLGDLTYNEGLTTDLNYFNYRNALKIFDYVNDDGGTTGLEFAYVESSPASVPNGGTVDKDDLRINNKLQLELFGGSPQNPFDPSTWGANALIAGVSGAEWFTIRDIVRSPTVADGGPAGSNDPISGGTSPGLPDDSDVHFPNPVSSASTGSVPILTATVATLPWHNDKLAPTVLYDTTPQARVVTVYASDGSTVSQSFMLVFSINNVKNSLSGGFQTVFFDGFNNGAGGAPGNLVGWRADITVGSNFGLTNAVTGEGPGFISLAYPSGSVNGLAFRRWETDFQTNPGSGVQNAQIPHIPNNLIYAARLTMSHNANDTSVAPRIRLGVQHATLIMSFLYWIHANDSFFTQTPPGNEPLVNPQVPAPNTNHDYEMFWASHGWTTNHGQLVFTPPSGPVEDLRKWGMFFDLLDGPTIGLKIPAVSEWKLKTALVISTDRPTTPSSGSRDVRTDLTSTSGGWIHEPVGGLTNPQGNTNGTPSVIQNSPSAGKVTFNDPGFDGLTLEFVLWFHSNMFEWENNKVKRFLLSLDVPTNANRENFHSTRFRSRSNFDHHNLEFLVTRRLFFPSVGSGVNNPMVPKSRQVSGLPTQYEVYLDFQGPVPVVASLNASVNQQVRTFTVALDALPDSDLGALNSSAQVIGRQATQFTWHSLVIETLNEII